MAQPSAVATGVAGCQHLNNRRCDRSKDAKNKAIERWPNPPHLDNKKLASREKLKATLTAYGLKKDLNEEFDPGSG